MGQIKLISVRRQYSLALIHSVFIKSDILISFARQRCKIKGEKNLQDKKKKLHFLKMLFSRAAIRSSSLFKSAARRMKSSSAKEAAAEAESDAAAGGLAVAVATTFGTYMCADFLSNFLQHPTQKVSKKYLKKRFSCRRVIF